MNQTASESENFLGSQFQRSENTNLHCYDNLPDSCHYETPIEIEANTI